MNAFWAKIITNVGYAKKIMLMEKPVAIRVQND
jgi:hypothetical protein